ncbi:MAG TPA: sigma-70 family RNA polymerase sigma factor [Haliscomenobacter sp.]|uniref:RNA polymerase sigma factor n=1 Tax=Haliscomenobacter sp. TaxID=2717303 RepID=UPI002BF5E141|nr:sigma-70 family RNA polymerase sigma factor [Haliscomenobacter sp.]HOY15858.1 sigma-70 family RNA polymerase sigma factor [Haliscomenobacter sp.]
MSDENYLHALCAGDTQRIRSIYQQYAGQIQRWVEDNNGSAADAQDLFQDGLIAIYDRYCGSDFQLSSSFGALLFGICKRKWFDRLKEKNRETVVRKVEEERYNDDHDPSIDSEAAFQELQKQETLVKTFALLSAQCQQMLTLLGRGVAAEQIALQLSIANANAVYQSKHRCMSRWKELFSSSSKS